MRAMMVTPVIADLQGDDHLVPASDAHRPRPIHEGGSDDCGGVFLDHFERTFYLNFRIQLQL